MLGTAHIAVIGRLVVVPDHDPRGPGVGGLKLTVRFVAGVAGPIVSQGDAVMGRFRLAVQQLAGFEAVPFRGIFINVVAQVQDGIDPPELGDGLISVEIAAGIEAAGGHGQDHILHRAGGQGAGAAHGRGDAIGGKFVGIGPLGIQTGNIDLDRIIAAGVGDTGARLCTARPAIHGG